MGECSVDCRDEGLVGVGIVLVRVRGADVVLVGAREETCLVEDAASCLLAMRVAAFRVLARVLGEGVDTCAPGAPETHVKTPSCFWIPCAHF